MRRVDNRPMFRLSRSSRVALWAAVFSLLLKTAVPLLAATAAELRGVPVASVCAIYGVAMPSSPGNHAAHAGPDGTAITSPVERPADAPTLAHVSHREHAGHGGQADPGTAAEHGAHAGHGGHAEAGAAAAHAGAADPASHGDHSHAEDKHGGGHCALTALAALAVPDAALAGVPLLRDGAPDHAPTRADAFHDASAAWVARLKHGPPAAA